MGDYMNDKEMTVKRLRYISETSLVDAFPFVVSSFLHVSTQFAEDEEVKRLIGSILEKSKDCWGEEPDEWSKFKDLWEMYGK